MDWATIIAVIVLIVAPMVGLLGLARYASRTSGAPKKEAQPKSK